jgi:hypothetical protein
MQAEFGYLFRFEGARGGALRPSAREFDHPKSYCYALRSRSPSLASANAAPPMAIGRSSPVLTLPEAQPSGS